MAEEPKERTAQEIADRFPLELLEEELRWAVREYASVPLIFEKQEWIPQPVVALAIRIIKQPLGIKNPRPVPPITKEDVEEFKKQVSVQGLTITIGPPPKPQLRFCSRECHQAWKADVANSVNLFGIDRSMAQTGRCSNCGKVVPTNEKRRKERAGLRYTRKELKKQLREGKPHARKTLPTTAHTGTRKQNANDKLGG